MNALNALAGGFRKLWRYPWQNCGLLLHAGALTAGVRAGLSISSLSHVTRTLRHVAMALPRGSAATPQYRLRAAWAARAVGKRLLPNRPCLTQALVLQYLLLRRGEDSAQLHIGVTKGKEEELQAHIWVEGDGRVFIGGTDAPEMYERFEDLETEIGSSNAPKRSS